MRGHSLRPVVSFGLVALALMANGRMPIAEAQTAPPASPSVALSASPASAQAGQRVRFKWSSTNATSITLEPWVGPVAVKGSTTVRPSQSITYTLTATGPGGSAHASAQVTITPAPPQAAVQKPSEKDISSDQEQMRGLDEQIQEIKSDSLRMSAELSQLEEKLLYPSGTQVAIFVELAKGDAMRLDAVRLQIDGRLAARPVTGGDLRDHYCGEALYHAYQGQSFDALQRLDPELAQSPVLDEPKLDTLHYHSNDAEFSVGDFELDYRMHQRAGRAIKAVLEGAVDEAVRNEAAFRLAPIHFQKGQLDDALQALAPTKGTEP